MDGEIFKTKRTIGRISGRDHGSIDGGGVSCLRRCDDGEGDGPARARARGPPDLRRLFFLGEEDGSRPRVRNHSPTSRVVSSIPQTFGDDRVISWAREKNWPEARIRAIRRACEICGFRFGDGRPSPHIDHIVPYVVAKVYGDPDDRRNLICLCEICHAKKTKIDSFIKRGDLARASQAFRRAGWNFERIRRAFAVFGLASTFL